MTVTERIDELRTARRLQLAAKERAEREAAAERRVRVRADWRVYAEECLRECGYDWLTEWVRWNAIDPTTFPDGYQMGRFTDPDRRPFVAVDLPGCFSIYVEFEHGGVVGFRAVNAAADAQRCESLADALIFAERHPCPLEAKSEQTWADDGGPL